ncbi:MAG TPA: hypothetical protein VF601_21130 [Beijerinckiaceae bacterium]
MPALHAAGFLDGAARPGVTNAGETAPWTPGRILALALPVWILVVAASLWLDGAQALVALPDPDDAMRLVQVRDLLAGQGWFDLVQHRANPPDGLPMHWSRLVDAPLAAMILLLRPLLGPDAAERWTLLLWPLVPALLLLPAAGIVGGRLAGRAGAALALVGAAVAVPLVRHFVPGRIDHHNLQMALSMALVAALVTLPRRPAAAWAAGAASALSLAVGMETLPYVALGGLSVMAGWWAAGAARTPAVLAYLASFAAAAALAAGLTVAPARWPEPACDFISPVYVAPLWAALAVAWAGRRHGLDRTRGGIAALVAAMALAAVAVVAGLAPACLGGPYAEVDPRLFWLWMDHLSEARSALSLARTEPAVAAAVFSAPLMALVLAPWLLGRARHREAAAVALGALGVATATALLQVRTLPFAAMFAGPPLAAAAALAIERFWRIRLDRAWGYALAGLVMNPLGVTAAVAVPAQALAPGARPDGQASERLCTRRSEYRTLAALPPGLVLNLIAFGPYVLAETPHRVLAAPYHRNRDGILDTVGAFTADLERARAILAARGVDYVAFCTSSRELDDLVGPGSLGAALKENKPPSWLEGVPDSGGVTRVYRVRRD